MADPQQRISDILALFGDDPSTATQEAADRFKVKMSLTSSEVVTVGREVANRVSAFRKNTAAHLANEANDARRAILTSIAPAAPAPPAQPAPVQAAAAPVVVAAAAAPAHAPAHQPAFVVKGHAAASHVPAVAAAPGQHGGQHGGGQAHGNDRGNRGGHGQQPAKVEVTEHHTHHHPPDPEAVARGEIATRRAAEDDAELARRRTEIEGKRAGWATGTPPTDGVPEVVAEGIGKIIRGQSGPIDPRVADAKADLEAAKIRAQIRAIENPPAGPWLPTWAKVIIGAGMVLTLTAIAAIVFASMIAN